jgi:trehalose-6-phosphate synthase
MSSGETIFIPDPKLFLRLNTRGENMWTKESLCELVKANLRDYLFISVSNREPYIHTFAGDKITCQMPASGLTVALDPVMQACGGIWIAHGSGDADKESVDPYDKVDVPPENPKYSLRRIWLTKEEEDRYYYGLANEALWPLCHIVYNRPIFRQSDWEAYVNVNKIFAQTVKDEIKGRDAFVFIQDYHLAPLAKLIKSGRKNKNIISAQFWHIPWPNPEAFRICPWQKELLEGLLCNDLLGFHIRYHCNNFMDTVSRALEARVDYERYEIMYNDHKTAIRPFPISVDFEEINLEAQKPEVDEEIKRLRKNLGLHDEIIGIGIERYDYTKGIPERLKAIDLFLQHYPEYWRKFIFIQVGAPSRVHIEAYKALNQEIDNLVEQINYKYMLGGWKPIILIRENLPPLTLMALRKMSNFCVVSALHDGMNLVAKEYVASRYDEEGVLILSPFTGSSRELPEALLINPYSVDEFSEIIKKAVEMPQAERQKRMKRMRATVKENNIYKWAGDIITDLVKFEFGG